jgi:hypothetical protein
VLEKILSLIEHKGKACPSHSMNFGIIKLSAIKSPFLPTILTKDEPSGFVSFANTKLPFINPLQLEQSCFPTISSL